MSLRQSLQRLLRTAKNLVTVTLIGCQAGDGIVYLGDESSPIADSRFEHA